MMKKIIISILLLSTASFAQAETYWISPTGEASNLAACSGSTPLSGTQCCSYDKANGSGVVAGDTVYYREGDYTGITGTAIYPYNSGTNLTTGRIVFSSYNSETVTFHGGSYGSDALTIYKSNDYIKVHGIDFNNFGRMLWTGGLTGDSTNNQCNYIEISNCEFRYMYNDNVGVKDYYGTHINHSQHYWIHDCVFEDYGDTDYAQADYGILFEIGYDNGDDSTGTNKTGYALIDNCIFKKGLHNVLSTHGQLVVVRNSTAWSPPRWTVGEDTIYGGRPVFAATFTDSDDLQHMYENNKVGYGGESSAAWAGNVGFKFSLSNSIIRYNTILKTNLSGIDIDVRHASSGEDIIWYNNTVWDTADYTLALPKTPAGNYRYTVSVGSGASDNIFKNNIFWENYNTGTTFIRNDSGTITTSHITNWATIDTDNWLNNNAQDPLFTDADDTEARDYEDYDQFDFILQSSSPCIDAGVYLTTATYYDANTVSVGNARYFFDGWGIDTVWNDLGANVQPDTLTFSTSSTDSTAGAITKQIASGGADWTNNRLTITGHGLSQGTTYYVWLYADSDGTRVLYGTGTDMGAYESTSASVSGTPSAPTNLHIQ